MLIYTRSIKQSLHTYYNYFTYLHHIKSFNALQKTHSMQSIHLRNSCFGSESRPSSPPLSGNLLHGRPWWSRDVQLGSISANHWDSKSKKDSWNHHLLDQLMVKCWSLLLFFFGKSHISFLYLKSLFAEFWMWGNFSKGWNSNCLGPTLNVFDRPPISICTKQKSKQKVKMVHWYLHPQKFNNSPLKNDSLKTRLSFWGPAYFRGELLNFQGVAGWWLGIS